MVILPAPSKNLNIRRTAPVLLFEANNRSNNTAAARGHVILNYQKLFMKSSYLLFSATLLLFSGLIYGQKVSPTKSNLKPAITKGYYSIGSNSQKLSVGNWPAPDTFVNTNAGKGYHSIHTNGVKLPKKSGWFAKKPARPAATKGYYSIGNMKQKHDSSNINFIVKDSSRLSTSR